MRIEHQFKIRDASQDRQPKVQSTGTVQNLLYFGSIFKPLKIEVSILAHSIHWYYPSGLRASRLSRESGEYRN